MGLDFFGTYGDDRLIPYYHCSHFLDNYGGTKVVLEGLDLAVNPAFIYGQTIDGS